MCIRDRLYDGEIIYEEIADNTVNNNEIANEKQNKQNEYRLDGIVLAAAGIKRIGRDSEITQYFTEDDMIPAPAQGTLALELRADNAKLMAKLDALSDCLLYTSRWV